MTDETEAPAPVVERRTRAPRAPAEPMTIDVIVKRDVWDAAGERHRAGTVRTVTVEEAMDGIEAGLYSRHKG
jgi:hypothetical protein